MDYDDDGDDDDDDDMMMDCDETWRSRDETWRRSRDMMDYQGATERHPRIMSYRGEATPTTSWVLGGFHRGQTR